MSTRSTKLALSEKEGLFKESLFQRKLILFVFNDFVLFGMRSLLKLLQSGLFNFELFCKSWLNEFQMINFYQYITSFGQQKRYWMKYNFWQAFVSLEIHLWALRKFYVRVFFWCKFYMKVFVRCKCDIMQGVRRIRI